MLSQWAGLSDPSDQTDIGYSGRGGLISISLAPGLRPRGLPPEGPDPSWSKRRGSGLLGGGEGAEGGGMCTSRQCPSRFCLGSLAAFGALAASSLSWGMR